MLEETNISSPKYDVFRQWIRKRRDQKKTWEYILWIGRASEEESKKDFQWFAENVDPGNDIDKNIWVQIVESEKAAEKRLLDLREASDAAIVFDPKIQDGDVSVPLSPQSSWQLYRKHLAESGWNHDSIEELESATLGTLKRLSKKTEEGNSIKGLVIGHVQSGKTANMAAVMAMAGDWGWNLFIVLSGTIESLRRQTQSRLFNDLNRAGNIFWFGLEHPSKISQMGQRAQDLQFGEDSLRRYFTVCLKNSTRLKNMIEWIYTDRHKCGDMKIIIIDDESDQAGVNTADINKEERTKINGLIVNLVEGFRADGTKPNLRPQAINYIGYTATPYANFLNESFTESLYPKDFIRTLRPSNEYFGPKQIFGLEEEENCDGLDIIRFVSNDELKLVADLHSGKRNEIPRGLKEAVAWFFCVASAMRLQGHKKPISMLIHTSQRQPHHKAVADALTHWSRFDRIEILNLCEEIWDEEQGRFSFSDFRNQYPDYGRLDEDIRDYPSFADIKPEINKLINQITHIPLDSEGELHYHDGVHLCIDNCSNNGANDENMVVRLVYPDPGKSEYPSPAPAFIVVGGNTLSRGLTLEGLVSTYFIRTSKQADTLMQMGRWFGYRKGYELYPRIWMTEQCFEKFRFLTRLEQDLRNDLRRFMDAGVSPSAYGPRVLNSPKISWLRITSASRMQGAIADQMDFTGTSSQTVVFDNDKNILQENIDITENFLRTLGDGKTKYSKTALVWEDVSFQKIEGRLFKKFHFNQSGRVFNQLDAFCEWYKSCEEEADFTGWNVIVAGVRESENKSDAWELPGGTIWKVNRSRLRTLKEDVISIGVLRAPKDLIADIDESHLSGNTKERLKMNPENINADNIREEAGLSKTPQLIIYRIKKDSVLRAGEDLEKSQRADLNAPEDIVGLSFLIPGSRCGTTYVKKLTVRIQTSDIETISEVIDTE